MLIILFFLHCSSCVLFWDTRPPKGPSQHGSKEKAGGPKNPMGVPDTFKHLDLTWKPMLRVGAVLPNYLHFHDCIYDVVSFFFFFFHIMKKCMVLI